MAKEWANLLPSLLTWR